MAPDRTRNGPQDLDAIGLPAFAYVRRGYDPDQVVAHLANVATELDDLRTYAGQLEDTDEQLRLALDDADREIAELIQSMDERVAELVGQQAETVLAPAREEAAAIRARSEGDAQRILDDIRSKIDKLQGEADRRAKAKLRQADDEASTRQREADQIVRRAQEQADQIRTEARNHADEVRREAERIRNVVHTEVVEVRQAAAAEAESLQLDAEMRAEEMEESGRERAADLLATGEELLAQARAQAADLVGDARSQAVDLVGDARSQADDLLDQAHGEAEDVATTAHERAAALLDETHETCDRLLAELEARRAYLLAEVDQLSYGRDQLLEAYAIVRETFDEAVTSLDGVPVELDDGTGNTFVIDAADEVAAEIARRRASHRRAARLDGWRDDVPATRGRASGRRRGADPVIVIDDDGDAGYEPIGTVGMRSGSGPDEVPPPARRSVERDEDDVDEGVGVVARQAAASSPHAAPVGRQGRRRSSAPANEDASVIPPVARRAPDPVEFQGRFSSAVRVLPPTPSGGRPSPTSPFEPMIAPADRADDVDEAETPDAQADAMEATGQLLLPTSLDAGVPTTELEVQAAVESVTPLRPEPPAAPRSAPGAEKTAPLPPPPHQPAPAAAAPAPVEDLQDPQPAAPVVVEPAEGRVGVTDTGELSDPRADVADAVDPAGTAAVLEALATAPRESAFLHAPLRGVTGDGVATGTKDVGGERHPWWAAPPLTPEQAPAGPFSTVDLVTALVQSNDNAAVAEASSESLDPEIEVRQRVDVVVAGARRTLRRRLKGMLADDQNAMLDALRQVKVGVPPSAGILPDEGDHRARFMAAAVDGLRSAAEDGRTLAVDLVAEEARRHGATEAEAGIVDGPGTALDDVARWLTDELLDVLRARLLACFPGELMISDDKKVDHARRDEVQNAIRSVYRRLKAGKVDTLIERASVEVVYRSVRDHLPPGVHPAGIEPLDLFRAV